MSKKWGMLGCVLCLAAMGIAATAAAGKEPPRRDTIKVAGSANAVNVTQQVKTAQTWVWVYQKSLLESVQGTVQEGDSILVLNFTDQDLSPSGTCLPAVMTVTFDSIPVGPVVGAECSLSEKGLSKAKLNVKGGYADDFVVAALGPKAQATLKLGYGNDIGSAGETYPGSPVGAQKSKFFGEGDGDVLVGGSGADLLNGGSENDALYARDGSTTRDTLICGTGADSYTADPADRLKKCENAL